MATNMSSLLQLRCGLRRLRLATGPSSECPSVIVSYPDDVDLDRPVIFKATVTDADPRMKPTYTWSISAGKIISGQGTPILTVDGSNLAGQSLTVTISVGGADPACSGMKASVTLPVR